MTTELERLQLEVLRLEEERDDAIEAAVLRGASRNYESGLPKDLLAIIADGMHSLMTVRENAKWLSEKVDKLKEENANLEERRKAEFEHANKWAERAHRAEAEIVRLKRQILSLEQTRGEECDKCGWAMKFPGELCRCELEAMARQKALKHKVDP